MQLDFRDDALIECIRDIISALLPHQNYDPKNFSLLYPLLKTVLDTDSVTGLFYPFYVIFDKYVSLTAMVPDKEFEVRITRERFIRALENNLPDLILEPAMDVVNLMAEEGKAADINIPTVQQEVMGVIYEKAMAMYDICYEAGQSYADAVSRIVDLKDLIKSNLIETGMSKQRVIMSTGLRSGRKFYRGPSGWLEYVQNLSREISELERASEGDLECLNLDVLPTLDDRNVELGSPLGEYGIPPIDRVTPMFKHRLSVIVARENVGKTKVCIHLIASLIRKGVKPFFACGESPKEVMFNSIVSSYIFQEYNMFFEPPYLSGAGYEQLDPDEKQIVNTAKARVASSGLVISNNLAYDNVVAKITHYYNKGCEAFFIDHTQSLRGRGRKEMSSLVADLALDCRQLKNDLPIFICLTSHPSVDLKDLMQKEQTKGIQKSPTAQSAAPSQEADELFILHETELLKTQGLLAWITYKTRGGEKIKPIYILKRFNVSSFVYDPRYQGTDSIDENDMTNFISGVGIDDSDDYEDEDDDDMVLEF